MELKFINRIWSMKVETQQCILVWHSEASGQLYKNRVQTKVLLIWEPGTDMNFQSISCQHMNFEILLFFWF